MVYLKSLFAGLAAAVLAEFLLIDAIFARLMMMSIRHSGQFVFIAWDPVSFARRPAGWLISVAAFIIGFSWRYRKLAPR